MTYRPPMLGFEDFEGHAEDLAPFTIQWRDGTPVGSMGILGDPSKWEDQRAQRLAEEAEEARREELRTLHEKVVILDDWSKPFLTGRAKTGGRIKGSRNLISEAFLKDLAAEWQESGVAALKVMAKTDPSNFVKVTAALLPKEFEITETILTEMPDEEINELRNELKRRIAERRATISDAGRGDGTPTHH
jgi:hypothetical protein